MGFHRAGEAVKIFNKNVPKRPSGESPEGLQPCFLCHKHFEEPEGCLHR